MAQRILTSIHGKKLGLSHDGRLIAPQGIMLGENAGQQVRIHGPCCSVLWDDFTNHGFNTNVWLATEGTDSATSSAAILAGGLDGVLRLTTGDAGTGYAADAEQITGKTLQWQADNGSLIYEIRVKLSAITTCYVFLGLTDTIAASLEQPIYSAGSANTITTDASDAVGFFFDTGMTDDNWWIAGVKGDTDATHQDTGFAPVADTYETFHIELTTDGDAIFYRNGLQVGTKMTGAVTANVPLAPIFTVSKLSVAASMTMDVDYVHVSQNRLA